MCMKMYGVSCGIAVPITAPGTSHDQQLHREALRPVSYTETAGPNVKLFVGKLF
jgi:hypothetical protein